ncbi:MAG: DNA polymerase III subunit beta [Elusimicrobia bacterium ADurb.Bin231]|nr:MAG: DNA polymerase III subunit beta [Elusimicrobia bacterium ADurb.Bin231]
MKIVCTRSELLKGANIVSGAVSQKSTLPLLSNLLFEAKDDKLSLAATDLEVAIKTTIKAQVLNEGGITLPSKLIADIIKKTATEEIEISVDEQSRVTVKSGRTKYFIVGTSKDEFPGAIDLDNGKKFTMPASVLKEMLIKTKFAVSTDETRYALNGVYFIIDKGDMITVATDGKRLTYVKKTGITSKQQSMNFIVPSKAIEELLKICSALPNEDVEIGISENQIGFQIKETVLRSRLVDGNFPNYEQVIPKETKGSFKANVKELLAATERVALVASGRPVPVKYSLSADKLLLYAKEQGKGEGSDEMEVTYKGNPFEAAYNPVYVVDMLKTLDCEDVIFEFTTAVNPALMKPGDDSGYLYIIMPMRLD